ncbi:metallophosphoesterase [Hungatella effluvii]|uniref:metallophosphoesterase n=1 Tax=Hungatella effluvii TaxID=1096246 RepID=UPI0022E19D1B|nr:metallophosphoesterase [Hungatella effluvii]
MRQTRYYINAGFEYSLTIALISDLHDKRYTEVLDKMLIDVPNFIAINGDILYACQPGYCLYDAFPKSGQHLMYSRYAYDFIKEAVKIAPVLFSTGNHELYFDESDRELLANAGACFLDDSYIRLGNVVFGGLSSPYNILAGKGRRKTRQESRERWNAILEAVKTSWLDEFEEQAGYKILLCHHPEFYDLYLKDRKEINLILAGHAHGGQIRLFGHGLYAHGQGFFPKYTSGIYNEKMIVSRGLANTSKRVPRKNNPTELVYVELISEMKK